MTDQAKQVNGKELSSGAFQVRTAIEIEIDTILCKTEEIQTEEEARDRVGEALHDVLGGPYFETLKDQAHEELPTLGTEMDVSIRSEAAETIISVHKREDKSLEEILAMYPGSSWEWMTPEEIQERIDEIDERDAIEESSPGPHGCDLDYPHVHLPDGTPVPIIVASSEEEMRESIDRLIRQVTGQGEGVHLFGGGETPSA